MLNLYLLCKHLGIRPTHVVEIGVNEPEASKIRGFLENGWYDQATLIEPIPDCAARIREAYGNLSNVYVLQIAITETSSMVELYNQGQSTFLGSLSTSPALASGYVPNAEDKFASEGHTFDAIDPGDIDVLAVSTEGSEWWAISRLRSRPRVIVCGTHSIMHYYQNPYFAEIKNWMAENGYQEIAQTIDDTVWFKGSL